MKLHFLELLKMVIAYALAFPIGWERERDERTAGIRTFPLVCMASCAYVLVGTIYFQSADANARVIQGLLSGVGFIGAGAIIQDRFRVHGTATAAAILGV